MTDIRWCYRLLGLKPGACLPEVKRAYRKLVREWHPDQFADDPRLRARANAMLTEINLAYRHLSSFLSYHRRPFEFVGPLNPTETRDWRTKTQGTAIRKWAARVLKSRFRAYLYPWRLFDPKFYRETFGSSLARAARILALGASSLVTVTALVWVFGALPLPARVWDALGLLTPVLWSVVPLSQLFRILTAKGQHQARS